MLSYKETLSLPRTDFSMKLKSETESKIQERWFDLYSIIRTIRKGKPIRMVHDGPPYANGNIHLGHIFNKILKDFIVRYLTMAGYDSPFRPGWDCHGLPIEHKIQKQTNDQQIPIRSLCYNEALKWVKIQSEQFQHFGILADWEHPYLTLDHSYEVHVIDVLKKLVDDDLLSRKLRPIVWCSRDQTALAEAELEYKEITSDSIYVEFPIAHQFPRTRFLFSLIAWTTTPWSIPGNVALAVNEQFDYDLIEIIRNDKINYIVVGRSLVDSTLTAAGMEGKVVATCKGSDLIGMTYRHPLFYSIEESEPEDIKCGIVVSGDFVTETGTGVIHIAPSHGKEDYHLAVEKNLPVDCPIDHTGKFVKGTHSTLDGLFAGSPRTIEIICDELKELLWAKGKTTHSYPHCWRCKCPTITRTTEQWFINLSELRTKALDATNSIDWVPKIIQNRMISMLANRPDWCVSRQRQWGIPIPSVICCDCNKVILTDDTIDLWKKHGSDWWFSKDPTELSCFCPQCGGSHFVRQHDILDVWFESGTSFLSAIPSKTQEVIYCEGTDQHRGWFQSSLLLSIVINEKSSFNTILTHGWIVDETGKKFAKSQDAPPATKILDKFGADVLRLFIASQDYVNDLKINDVLLENSRDIYNKIRNTFRFILGNVNDFQDKSLVTSSSPLLSSIDLWILSRLNNVIRETTNAYETYHFVKAYHCLFNFCTMDLSSIYFDVSKDRLYATEGIASRWTLVKIYQTLTLLFAPILPHLAEELWSYISEKSVFLIDFPTPILAYDLTEETDQLWLDILKLRNSINVEIEILRNQKEIKQNEEVSVVIYSNEDWVDRYGEILREFCKLSEVLCGEKPDGVLSQFKVQRTVYDRCARCLRYRKDVKKDICVRCKIFMTAKSN